MTCTLAADTPKSSRSLASRSAKNSKSSYCQQQTNQPESGKNWHVTYPGLNKRLSKVVQLQTAKEFANAELSRLATEI